jgi:hypothetical protein
VEGEPPGIVNRLIGLQYWFFYPYNYYPTVVGAELMNEAPLAGDIFNTDIHQGDWEHVTVSSTRAPPGRSGCTPRAMPARASSIRGAAQPSASMTAIRSPRPRSAGIPSYPSGCGAQPRQLLRNLSSDWLVCGSGRFAFRAATTPRGRPGPDLVGVLEGQFRRSAANGVSDPNQFDRYYQNARGLVHVDGPPSPLWQAANGDLGKGTGVCRSGDPAATERAAMRSLRR